MNIIEQLTELDAKLTEALGVRRFSKQWLKVAGAGAAGLVAGEAISDHIHKNSPVIGRVTSRADDLPGGFVQIMPGLPTPQDLQAQIAADSAYKRLRQRRYRLRVRP